MTALIVLAGRFTPRDLAVDLAAPAEFVRGVATPVLVTAFFAIRILVGVLPGILSGALAAGFPLCALLRARLLADPVPPVSAFLVGAFLVGAFLVGVFLVGVFLVNVFFVSARGLRDLVMRDFVVAARAPRAFVLLVMA